MIVISAVNTRWRINIENHISSLKLIMYRTYRKLCFIYVMLRLIYPPSNVMCLNFLSLTSFLENMNEWRHLILLHRRYGSIRLFVTITEMDIL